MFAGTGMNSMKFGKQFMNEDLRGVKTGRDVLAKTGDVKNSLDRIEQTLKSLGLSS